MCPEAPKVARSPLEEGRFGVRTARVASFEAGDLDALLDFCRRERVQMLVARCETSDLAAAQALEAAGGRLMDTLVFYERDLAAPLPEAPAAPAIRPARAEDAAAVVAVARAAFRDYRGHYHADPRLDRQACDDVYASWAERSCLSRDAAEEVLVADVGGALEGFLTLKWNSAEEGEGPLYAVAPRVQQRGVGSALMASALRWFRERGAARMVMSTQVTNVASQKSWVRLGFEPARSFYTFHAWFDAV